MISDRYARTRDGKFLLEITTDCIEDLFNNFDRNSLYLKKDLNKDLVDYLIDSAKEIGQDTFIIHFRIVHLDSKTPIDEVKTDIENYFYHLKELELKELNRMRNTSLILLSVGLVILTLLVLVNQYTELYNSIIIKVLAEGLTVAAWVSLWEALATFIIRWKPHQQNIRLYEHIAKAPVTFSKVQAVE
jgi:hypothetical protein